jgi:hypothetical protein
MLGARLNSGSALALGRLSQDPLGEAGPGNPVPPTRAPDCQRHSWACRPDHDHQHIQASVRNATYRALCHGSDSRAYDGETGSSHR